MDTLQNQTATLKKVNAPSDDPVGTAKILEIRTDKVVNDQYQMNAKLAETFLTNSDHALADLAEVVGRAKEIAIGQSSGASSNDETRVGVAEEISQLYRHAVATANRRIGDRYLFSGYKTNRAAVNPEGEFVGDDGQMMVEIAKGVYLTMNVSGNEAFNTHPVPKDPDQVAIHDGPKPPPYKPGGESEGRVPAEEQKKNPENVNVFDELQNLRIALLTGDLEGIRGTLERFDQIHGKIVATRSKIGSRVQGLMQTDQALERHNVTNAYLNSALEDADMAQVVSDLAKEEQVLRSSLVSSQKLIQPKLLDFLK
jgi:flagellar hook-associated protein 3 FlgL